MGEPDLPPVPHCRSRRWSGACDSSARRRSTVQGSRGGAALPPQEAKWPSHGETPYGAISNPHLPGHAAILRLATGLLGGGAASSRLFWAGPRPTSRPVSESRGLNLDGPLTRTLDTASPGSFAAKKCEAGRINSPQSEASPGALTLPVRCLEMGPPSECPRGQGCPWTPRGGGVKAG